MSPEQARGKTLDKRADIWAFGCVLDQMLTGRTAFPGETLSDTIVAILDRTPDWSAVPTGTPATVSRLLRRCLEKDARKQLRDIGDARIDLEASSDSADLPFVWQLVRRETWRSNVSPMSKGSRNAVHVARRQDDRVLARSSPAGVNSGFVCLPKAAVLQLTRDDTDHMHPRCAPHSNTLIYFTPPASDSETARSGRSVRLADRRRRSSAPLSPAISATTVGASPCCNRRNRNSRSSSRPSYGSQRRAHRAAARGILHVVRCSPDDRSIALSASLASGSTA